MSAGELLPGHRALDELRAAIGSPPRWRLRIPPGSAVTFAVTLGHWKIADQVELVEDPSLPVGSAVWLPPFRMPYRAFLVRAGDVDEAMRWCARRGISIGMREEPDRRGWAVCVFEPADYRFLAGVGLPEQARSGELGVVTLPGYPGLSEPLAQTELELAGAVMLEDDWAPDIPGVVLGVS